MMRTFVVSSCLAVALVGALAFPAPALADDRKADDILKEIKAVEVPVFDPSKQKEAGYINGFLAKQQKAMTKRAALIGELYKLDPENAELTQLLPARWLALLGTGPSATGEVAKEVEQVRSTTKVPKLKTEAAFFQAKLPLLSQNPDSAMVLKAAEEFAKAAPEDKRAGGLLMNAAMMTENPDRQAAIYRRVAKDFPGSPAAKQAEGKVRMLDSIGKPFDLEFTDAVKGSEVSMKGLKGKVVVVDFWATWCGPCVAEMPKMKSLYAEYKGKGVEFIGVSLDQPKEQGGLDKLKEFVAKNDIPWLQYYQGNGWESAFSSGWGVNSIPCVFVVDADGKLASVDARGKLETLIPDLLKKAKSDSGAGAGGN